jgi:hypothetical protein
MFGYENIPFPLPAVGDSLAALVVAVVGVITGACRISVSGSMVTVGMYSSCRGLGKTWFP